MLTFILVQSLDLNIKYRVGVKLNAVSIFKILRKLLFVAELYFFKLFEHRFVICILFEL